jgi:hypothetical protein
MSEENRKEKKDPPSAVEDCADVQSRYKRFKEGANKPKVSSS